MTSARMCAPRARANSSSSRMRMPAPSPTTKPSRSLSNGRQAWVGSSLRVERAFMAAKPATPSGVMEASVPPAIIASASPRSMMRKASPMECAEEVQAVAVASLGPRAPNRIETWPAARLMMEPGRKERGTLARAAGEQVGVFALDDVEAADPRTDVNAHAIVVRFIDLQARMVHGLLGSRDRKMDEAAHLAGLLFIDEKERIEVLHLGGEPHRMAGEVERFDLGHAAAAREQTFPDFRDGPADSTYEA